MVLDSNKDLKKTKGNRENELKQKWIPQILFSQLVGFYSVVLFGIVIIESNFQLMLVL